MSTLYVTDLDGTLLDQNAQLSAETVQLLNPLLDAGLPFTVATARSPATAVELLRPLHLSLPVVLMTGTLLYDLRNTCPIKTRSLSQSAVDAVCTVLENARQESMAYCVKNGHINVYYNEFACDFERTFVSTRVHSPYKTFVQTENTRAAVAGGETMMFLICLPDIPTAVTLYRAFCDIPEIVCYYYADEYGSGGSILEIYPLGCNKAAALADVMQMTGAQKIISFGDNINDVPMFEISAESCAVANAVPEAKQAATHLIASNAENGVAKWIAAHWKGCGTCKI